MMRLKLSTKMILLGVGGVACFSLVLIWVYFIIEENVYSNKRIALRGVTEVAYTLITEYETRVNAGGSQTKGRPEGEEPEISWGQLFLD